MWIYVNLIFVGGAQRVGSLKLDLEVVMTHLVQMLGTESSSLQEKEGLLESLHYSLNFIYIWGILSVCMLINHICAGARFRGWQPLPTEPSRWSRIVHQVLSQSSVIHLAPPIYTPSLGVPHLSPLCSCCLRTLCSSWSLVPIWILCPGPGSEVPIRWGWCAFQISQICAFSSGSMFVGCWNIVPWQWVQADWIHFCGGLLVVPQSHSVIAYTPT